MEMNKFYSRSICSR